jgi:hypothetical protein
MIINEGRKGKHPNLEIGDNVRPDSFSMEIHKAAKKNRG